MILLCSREIVRAKDVFLVVDKILQDCQQFNTAAEHIWSILSNFS